MANNRDRDSRTFVGGFCSMTLGLRGVPRPFRAAQISALALAALLCALTASAGLASEPTKQEKEQRREEGRKLFGHPSKGKGAKKDPAPTETVPAQAADKAGWCIVLESFSGSTAEAQAAARLLEVREAAGRGDVRIRSTRRGAAIVAGFYESSSSPEARGDLEDIRARIVGKERPFSQAFLAPPQESIDPGAMPELNLTSAQATFGTRFQYTLQIGVYQSPKADEAKRAAEQAALTLRGEGELAFYYHGPDLSVVSIGLFTDDDFDVNLRPRNPTLIALQGRYPLNLMNGQFPIVEKRPGQPDYEQPSMLVRLP